MMDVVPAGQVADGVDRNVTATCPLPSQAYTAFGWMTVAAPAAYAAPAAVPVRAMAATAAAARRFPDKVICCLSEVIACERQRTL
jgi:hypothetical protein